MKNRIARINELYHKSQQGGLSDAEKEEQSQLRREYVEIIKGNFKQELDRVEIVDNDKPNQA